MSTQNTVSKTSPQELVKSPCPACVQHSGFTDDTLKVFCPTCQGAGTVLRPASETVVCPQCKGEGSTKETDGPDKGKSNPCANCASTGRVPADPSAPFHDFTKDTDNSVEARIGRFETRLASVEGRLARIEQIAGLV